MKRNIRMLMAATAVAVLASLAGAGEMTFVENFDNASNEGGWDWGIPGTFPSTGGNPDWYQRVDGLDTFAPSPNTTSGGIFVGDYRTAGVSHFGIDLITFAVDFSAEGRPATLMLIHDNDTPFDPFDDSAAYSFGPNIPLEGEGWISYDWDIPSDQSDLPAGWLLLNLGDSGAPAIHSWDEIIQHVSVVQIFYGDPTFFFIFQQWGLGMDNARITFASDGGTGDIEGRITICHFPPGNEENAHTITVNAASLPAHLNHGDFTGECTDKPTAAAAEGQDGIVDLGSVGQQHSVKDVKFRTHGNHAGRTKGARGVR